ncbi:hypothetical protein Bbelb_313510 [Branchiostoma belcheri]|nr:hypothetical protein Bbelb_313510 [Branchiostoma belcheri]
MPVRYQFAYLGIECEFLQQIQQLRVVPIGTEVISGREKRRSRQPSQDKTNTSTTATTATTAQLSPLQSLDDLSLFCPAVSTSTLLLSDQLLVCEEHGLAISICEHAGSRSLV